MNKNLLKLFCFTILLTVFVLSKAFSQTDSSATLTIYGNFSNKFKTIGISNKNVNASGDKVQAFTWTDNAHGYPDYIGRALVWYDVSGIPANATITSAKMYFYADLNAGDGVANQPTYGNNDACLLQKVISQWSAATVTFNNQPSITTSNQKTLPQSTSTAQNYVVTVTDFVQGWVNKPDSNFGVLLRMQTEYNPYNSLLFTGASADKSIQPKLVIKYTLQSSIPKVTISSNPASPICAGTKVTFTAKLVNGDSLPVFQWKKNNLSVGVNSPVYIDSILNNSDSVICTVTTAGTTVKSNKLKYLVNPVVTPRATIVAAGSPAVCLGGKIPFSASVTNGGTGPVYQWMKNQTIVGTNSLNYTDNTPTTGDTISFVLTSNAVCPTQQKDTSNILSERVDTPNPVIMIAANKDTTICTGSKVTFTATVKPYYLWQKNGSAVGVNSNKYIDSTLNTDDKIQCFLVSAASACNYQPSNILNSNILKFKVNAPPGKPAAITGLASVSANQTGVYYSVPAVTSVTYFWGLPSGAVIDSGQGGNKIKVTWGSASGNVSVTAANSCGISQARIKAVTVKSSLVGASNAIAAKKSIALNNNIQLTPNPAISSATLTFTTKTQAKYVVIVTDAQNKVVDTKTGVTIIGDNIVKINIAKYARGVYFITVASKENGQQSKKLVVGE